MITPTADELDAPKAADITGTFVLDGAFHEIDLFAENADAFGSALAPYMGAARRIGGWYSGSRSPGGFFDQPQVHFRGGSCLGPPNRTSRPTLVAASLDRGGDIVQLNGR